MIVNLFKNKHNMCLLSNLTLKTNSENESNCSKFSTINCIEIINFGLFSTIPLVFWLIEISN